MNLSLLQPTVLEKVVVVVELMRSSQDHMGKNGGSEANVATMFFGISSPCLRVTSAF